MATVYNDGLMETGWHSWSWGTDYYNQKSTAVHMEGSRSSLCVQVGLGTRLTLCARRLILHSAAAPPVYL